MFLELALPSLALMGIAILVPRMVETAVPETLFGMALTAILSSLILSVLAAFGFALLYQLENPRLAELLFNNSGGLRHFLLLGVQSALIWGPVLALVVSTAPRRWKTNVW